MKQVFFMRHMEARKRAMSAVAEAPDGFVVEIHEPIRSTSQNSLLWPLLECFSQQLEWPVNGRMTKLQPEEWKDLLSAAYRNEQARLAMGLNGGVVMLGQRTSKFTKSDFSEFLEFIFATAADRGVRIEKEECPVA